MADDLQRLLDEDRSEPDPDDSPALVAFLVAPNGKRWKEGRVVQYGALFLAQVGGKEYPASSLEQAVDGAWRMIDGLPPLPALVPAHKAKGGAA